MVGGFESSYVQVVELPKGVTSLDNVKPALLSQSVFASTGKFGMVGFRFDDVTNRENIAALFAHPLY